MNEDERREYPEITFWTRLTPNVARGVAALGHQVVGDVVDERGCPFPWVSGNGYHDPRACPLCLSRTIGGAKAFGRIVPLKTDAIL